MNSYLLLRSNKQSGPYSVEEIQSMGLKAYDLIWVEGKSAAWRYPGEIEELKSFAPPVEEQPFDRFFKRPTQINQPLPVRTLGNVSGQREEIQDSKLVAITHSPQYANKPIYVNPPVKPAPVYENESYGQAQPTNRGLTEKQHIVPKEQTERYQQNESLSSPSADAGPAQLHEKFSQPLDEIKKQYAEKVLGARTRTSSKGRFITPFALGFGIAALLAIGIFIGLTLNNRVSNFPKEGQQKEDNPGGGQQMIYHPKNMPLATDPAQQIDRHPNENQLTAEEQALLNNELSEKKRPKTKSRYNDSLHLSKAKIIRDSSTDRYRELVSPSENALTKEAVKNNIGDYVNVGATKYYVGTFGGISDLQITVSNRSLYALDLVVVEVQYIQSNKKIFKTETLYFRNIGAGSALMQDAPKSPRGVKVQYRITLINSKELGLSYSGI
ncbi:MAG: hypothetical protein ACHQET_01590 [Chitinophagales bacterium]